MRTLRPNIPLNYGLSKIRLLRFPEGKRVRNYELKRFFYFMPKIFLNLATIIILRIAKKQISVIRFINPQSQQQLLIEMPT